MPEQAPTPETGDSRLAELGEKIAAEVYEIDANSIAEAILRRLSGLDQPSELPEPKVPRPRITLAPSKPSANGVARA